MNEKDTLLDLDTLEETATRQLAELDDLLRFAGGAASLDQLFDVLLTVGQVITYLKQQQATSSSQKVTQ